MLNAVDHPRKLKGGVRTLFDHSVNAIAAAAMLLFTYEGRVKIPQEVQSDSFQEIPDFMKFLKVCLVQKNRNI